MNEGLGELRVSQTLFYLMSKSKDWEKPIELVFQIHIR